MPSNKSTNIQSKIREIFKALELPPILHDYSPRCFKYLPHFSGESCIIAEKHVLAFQCFLDMFEIIHEDVVLRLFYHSFIGDAQQWFQ